MTDLTQTTHYKDADSRLHEFCWVLCTRDVSFRSESPECPDFGSRKDQVENNVEMSVWGGQKKRQRVEFNTQDLVLTQEEETEGSRNLRNQREQGCLSCWLGADTPVPLGCAHSLGLLNIGCGVERPLGHWAAPNPWNQFNINNVLSLERTVRDKLSRDSWVA